MAEATAAPVVTVVPVRSTPEALPGTRRPVTSGLAVAGSFVTVTGPPATAFPTVTAAEAAIPALSVAALTVTEAAALAARTTEAAALTPVTVP
ncbi:hypothetical protein ACFQ0D_31080, partial [Micromonospora zhanjiangensis]